MKVSDFLRRQAELCVAISRSTFDLTMAGRLRAMAVEFRRKATELDDTMLVPHVINGDAALDHEHDRNRPRRR